MNGSWIFILMVIVFITVYSLLNYYFLRKHRNVTNLKPFPGILVKLVLITIILTPVATIIFSQHGPPFLAAITGFTGYSWLAFLFLFLVIHGLADLGLFILKLLGFASDPKTARILFFITLVLNISILVYGSYEARQIRIEYVNVPTTKLPIGTKNLKLIQLSDIHFSPLTGPNTAQTLLDIVIQEKPDLIVITGDLLDSGIKKEDEVISILQQMQAPKGKYAITGNHEFFAGIEKSTSFIQQAGFKLLRNEAVSVEDKITLVGMDDPTVKRFDESIDIAEGKILKNLNHEKFTLLLKHQPRIEESSLDYFDLQLSGHTHAGQIFPFTLLVKIAFPYLCGMYQLDTDTQLYVSRGTGTWGPPFRFLAPPEVTVISLVNGN
ncbi:metallophosphoesterase [bacterium]|nr:metallophosphoesterase [bacterium]